MLVKLKEIEKEISVVTKTWWIISKTVPSRKMETDSLTVFSHNQSKMAARTKRTVRRRDRKHVRSAGRSAVEQLISYQLLADDRSQKPLIGWGIFTRTRAHNVDRWLTAGIGSARKLKKCEIERPLNGILSCCCFLLGEFVSYINYTKKDWVLEEKHEINGLQLFVDHRDNDFWRDSLTLLTMNRSFRVQVLDM